MTIIIKEYNYGEGYFPKLFIDGKKIVDAKCKCTCDKNNLNAWKTGKKLCWHLVDSIKEFNMEVKKEQRKCKK